MTKASNGLDNLDVSVGVLVCEERLCASAVRAMGLGEHSDLVRGDGFLNDTSTSTATTSKQIVGTSTNSLTDIRYCWSLEGEDEEAVVDTK